MNDYQTAGAHVIVSHGADFFGQDRYPRKSLTSLAGYAEGVLSHAVRGPLVQLLQHPTEQGISPAKAGEFAELLLRISRHGWVKAKPSALARSLADAAARAAADGEHWQWRVTADTAPDQGDTATDTP